MNRYQPPPLPPQAKKKVQVDPLLALGATTAAPATIKAEELADLTDDIEAFEGGTQLLPKPASVPPPSMATPAPAPAQTIQQASRIRRTSPSRCRDAEAPAQPVQAQKSYVGLVLALVAGFVFVVGTAVVVVAFFVLRARDEAAASAAAATVAPVETTAPIATETQTADPPVDLQALTAPSATVTVTSPAPTHLATTAAQGVPPIHTTPVVITGAGWLRTFAAGNGKPITVDGHVIIVHGRLDPREDHLRQARDRRGLGPGAHVQRAVQQLGHHGRLAGRHLATKPGTVPCRRATPHPARSGGRVMFVRRNQRPGRCSRSSSGCRSRSCAASRR